LDVIVFDQCTDGNAWCRDAKYHLDLHTPNLAAFQLGGEVVPLAVPTSLPVTMATAYRVGGAFNNRKILWDFEPAPNYQGEPRFYFSKDSKTYYMRLIVTHLPNGIHGVEQWTGGQWKAAAMQGDAGQQWILPDPSVTTFKLRLTDASDQLVMQGRTWTMDFPTSCGTACISAATPADNVVGDGGSVSLRTRRAQETFSVQQEGARLVFRGPGGTVELRDVAGTLLGRIELGPAPASWTSPRSGLVLARWRGATAERTVRLLVP
jgi:hypothetical protein